MAILLLAGCLLGGAPAEDDCETVQWRDPDEANTSKKVRFDSRVVYDTTASSVSGVVTRRNNGEPIARAVVYLNDVGRIETDTTDSSGRFFIMRDGMSSKLEMRIVAPGYRCVSVPNLLFGGGLQIRATLERIN